MEDRSLVDDGGSFTNWEEGQPVPGGNTYQNCMHMGFSSGTWYDNDCYYSLYAVCSKPIASAPAAAAHNITRA